MGKGVKEYRINRHISYPVREAERLIVTTQKVAVFVKKTEIEKVQVWLHGCTSQKVRVKSKRRENEFVLMLEEMGVADDVEIRISIPESIKYLSVGTISGDVSLNKILPEQLRIKTNDGDVMIKDAPDRNASVCISTMKADIWTEFKAASVEVESKSLNGKTYSRHKTNGEATVKLEAITVSGDIHIS